MLCVPLFKIGSCSSGQLLPLKLFSYKQSVHETRIMNLKNVIETKYLQKFWFYYSKYSPPDSIRLSQRFNSDSNAYSTSYFGIAPNARVYAVISILESKRRSRLVRWMEI